jgi:hypothetical protein
MRKVRAMLRGKPRGFVFDGRGVTVVVLTDRLVAYAVGPDPEGSGDWRVADWYGLATALVAFGVRLEA